MALPDSLRSALRPVVVIAGHYGAGKTNFAVNLAVDLAAEGKRVTLVDLDVVNPYFRATEQRALLEEHGVHLVAPVFAETGTSLDVPSLTGGIAPALRDAGEGDAVIVDAGGDDVGATALGRFARIIGARDHALLYVANRYRNLVQEPADALENLREIEQACHLRVTAIVSNAHLKRETTPDVVRSGAEYAAQVAKFCGLPLVCTTVPPHVDASGIPGAYPVKVYVTTPWEA